MNTQLDEHLLSYQQENIWMISLKTIKPVAQCEIQIEGDLEVSCLRHSIESLILRHESLRTSYRQLQDQEWPLQIISPQIALKWQVINLRETDRVMYKKILKEIRAKDMQMIRQGELSGLICTLLRLAEQSHVLLITLSALSADAHTLHMLFRDLNRSYREEAPQQVTIEFPIQYVEFSDWQREECQNYGETAPTYWNSNNEQQVYELHLPFDAAVDAVAEEMFETISANWESDRIQKLLQMTEERGYSLPIFLLSCYSAMITLLTNKQKFFVGLAVDGRTVPELQNVYGLFARRVPLKASIDQKETFLELLDQVEKEYEAVVAWQDYYRFQDKDDIREKPPYVFGFSFVESSTDLRMEEHGWTLVDLTTYDDPLHLSLHCQKELNGHLTMEWRFDTSRYKREDMELLMRQFEMFVQNACITPQAVLEALPLLPEVDRQRLFTECNGSMADLPDVEGVHQLFEEQAKRTPDYPAITFNNRVLTYREVNEKAKRIAQVLQEERIHSGALVVICMQRSADSIIAILAVLKAGGAFVPLDLNDPPERIRCVLADACPNILLTTKLTQEQNPFLLDDAQIVEEVHGILMVRRQEGIILPRPGLAYIIYTSGSTGKPKGVMVEHRSLVNHILWASQLLFENPVRNVPQISRLSFDMSLKQIFSPLVLGFDVWILADETVRNPRSFLREIRGRKEVGINCVPTLWKSVLEVLETDVSESPCEQLIQLTFGGERLDEALLERTWRVLPHLRVNNFYGPTETTGNASGGRIEREERITIGRPTFNTQLYVLNSNLQPVAVGVPGEICVGGLAVARGYLNRDELTRKRFVNVSIEGADHTRLYKTGDLGRMLPNGRIEYLGRSDDQIKIRGFRVEIGEVEAAIEQHPFISEVAVIVYENGGGEPQLIAYASYREGIHITGYEVRKYLRTKLPDYMIPSIILPLDTMPRTATGKLDRRSLQIPDINAFREDETIELPRTQVEATLVTIWSKILGVERVGVNQNFFELGGHSLMGAQLIAHVWHAFRVDLPMRVLFDTSTLKEMSEQIEVLMRNDTNQSIPLIPVSREGALRASLLQERLWMIEKIMGDVPVFRVLLPLQLSGRVQPAAMQLSLNKLVKRHESLRTSFYEVDGKLYQKINAGGEIPFREENLRNLQKEKQAQELRDIAITEIEKPFDLESSVPLLRAVLVHLDEQESYMLLIMHHIVCDGWSLGVLTKDLSKLYLATIMGSSPELPLLNVHYADYAQWEQKFLQSKAAQIQLDYWEEQLGQGIERLQFPYDYPAPIDPTFIHTSHEFELGKELSEVLHAFTRKRSVTLFMTMLSAFKVFLLPFTSQGIIQLSTQFAKRSRGLLDGAVGLFTDTVILRTDLQGDPSFAELVTRVRDVMLQAVSNQEVPFEIVAERLESKYGFERSDIAQISVKLQIEPNTEQLPGLTISQSKVEEAIGEFVPTGLDLECTFIERTDGITFVMQYSEDRFAPETIQDLGSRFIRILSRAMKNIDSRLSEIQGDCLE